MNDRKPRDFAEAVKNFTEVTSTDRPAIKLGAKNKAKLDKIRRLAAQMKGK
jgi:hypothetical protein